MILGTKVEVDVWGVMEIQRKSNVDTNSGWLAEAGGRGYLSDLQDMNNEKERSELFWDNSLMV